MELGRRQEVCLVVDGEGPRLDPDPIGRILAQHQPLVQHQLWREGRQRLPSSVRLG